VVRRDLRPGRSTLAVAGGSLAVGFLLTLAKLVVGLLTGSLGILSEAVHSLLDVAASTFAFFAVRAAGKPPDAEHHYGHGRAENLAAYSEGVLLLLTAIGIAFEAVHRLFVAPARVDAAWYAMALLVVGMLIEAGRGFVLRWAGRAAGSDALTADADNRLADVLSSLGVLAGLVGVRLGYVEADSIAALLVSLLVGYAAVRILLRSGDELMDRAPEGAEADLREVIGGVDGVEAVRSVRVRRAGGRLLGDARVSTRRTLSVEGAQALEADVQEAVEQALPGVDLVLAVEAQARPEHLVERIHATAARLAAVRDLHNVTIEREADGTLHVSMHAKLPSSLTLAEAESAADRLEREVRQELDDVSRVDVHLEPLEPDLVRGRDVTGEREDLAQRIRRAVKRHRRVIELRDVELSARDGRITAHVVARLPDSLTLEEAHVVETELELELTRKIPELAEVIARVTG
jgi:cation diffusion facilitator family transporter